MIPLIIGKLNIPPLRVSDKNGWQSIRISPLGFYTAVAYAPGTLIITPSITACPPTKIEVRVIKYRIFLGIISLIDIWFSIIISLLDNCFKKWFNSKSENYTLSFIF